MGKRCQKGQEFVLILEDAFCSASNFLFAFSISVYPPQLVLRYKISGSWYLSGKCTDIDIDISKEYHGESLD